MSIDNTKFDCPVPDDLLFAANAFKKMAGVHGKSTKETRDDVRKSTTMFIHYIVDYAVQKKQGHDEQRQVVLKSIDIIKALNDLGYTEIADKIQSKPN